MCLSIAVSQRSFAIIATDTYSFGPAGPDGGPSSATEVPGGKLRSSVDGWMTVAGGSHCQNLLDVWDPELRLVDENQVREWLRIVDRTNSRPREIASWLTTVFHDGREFHLRAYDEHGGVAQESYATGEALAAIFPTGIGDVEVQQQLKRLFLEDLGRAVSAGAVELIVPAITRLFDAARERTPFLGPTTEAVILWTDGATGEIKHARMTHTPQEVAS